MLSVGKRRNLMKKRDNLERHADFSISMDLIVEILKKLPAKSLVRFRSVSKQLSSIIGSRRDFIESIVNRSLTQPPQKLPLFIFHHCDFEAFFTVSSVFSQSTKPAISLVPRLCEYLYERGLICCYSPESNLAIIYNPTTRQSFNLPEIKSTQMTWFVKSNYYFGYDPITNQYKVLNIMVENWKPTCHVYTLERGQSWRKIQISIDEKEILFPRSNQVCIDGTIYFVSRKLIKDHKSFEYVLLSFTIISEKFDYVRTPETMFRGLFVNSSDGSGTLVNYRGKLGSICCTRVDTSIWIMENVGKQEWSRISFWLPPLSLLGDFKDKFIGVTPSGEIFATPRVYSTEKSFHVYYYDMKQNSFRRVEIKCTTPVKIDRPSYWIRVIAIYNHVENTMWF